RQTCAFDFAGLKDDIAIRQEDSWGKAAQPLQHLDGAGEQLLREGVLHEEGGHRQQLHVPRMLCSITLEGADVIAIAQLSEEILQDPPVALACGAAESPLEMLLQILLDGVIVEQRIVDVDEEDQWLRRHHSATPALPILRRYRLTKLTPRSRHPAPPFLTSSKGGSGTRQ